MKVRKAIIPAAGLGTRFLPATKAQPKEMMPIVDKPAIQYIVEEAVASGIEEILIITGRNKRAIEDHFDRSVELEAELEKKKEAAMLKMVHEISDLAEIYYIRQKKPMGLGHAVSRAATFVGREPFAVMLGDDIVDSETPCLKQLLDVYDEYGCSVLGVQRVAEKQIEKFGIVDGMRLNERLYRVKGLVEKPPLEKAPSDVAILGRYVITPEVFPILEKVKPGAKNEIQLTDALNILSREQEMLAYLFEGKRYDIGDKLGFLQATVETALKRPEFSDQFEEYLKDLLTNRK